MRHHWLGNILWKRTAKVSETNSDLEKTERLKCPSAPVQNCTPPRREKEKAGIFETSLIGCRTTTYRRIERNRQVQKSSQRYQSSRLRPVCNSRANDNIAREGLKLVNRHHT